MITQYLQESGFTTLDILQIENLIQIHDLTLTGLPSINRMECINRVYLADDEFCVKLYQAYNKTKRHKNTIHKAIVAYGKGL